MPDTANSVCLLTRILAGIFAILALAACTRRELSEPPPRGSSVPAPKTEESVVGAHITLPFAALQSKANEAAPSHFAAEGRVAPKPCVKVGPKGDLPFGGHYDLTTNVCSDVDYVFSADRAGPVTIGPIPGSNAFRIQVPINFSGHAGFTGDVAKVLGLNKKNFDGGLNVWADISADVGADWCPTLSVKPGFDWRNNARIEVVGTPAIWIDVSGHLSGPLTDRLNALGEAMKSAITCGVIKDNLAKYWATQAIPVTLPTVGKVFINVDPVSVDFSGLSVGADRIEFGLRIRGKADVSTTALTSTAKPLPALGHVQASTPGTVALSVPLRAKYAPLEEALTRAVGAREFGTDTPTGRASVTIGKIAVYPSDGKLAVGIDFSAKLPSKWLSARGTVYLVGTPTAANQAHAVEIHDLAFTRIVDNELWLALTAIFETQIKGELNKHSTIDLSAQIEQARKQLQAALNGVKDSAKIDVSLTDVDMGISNITPVDSELVVTTMFRATVDAKLLGNN